jgi:tetrahydromethanopterin S-methyltransferase subunit G
MGATAHRDITVTYGLLVVFLVIMFSLVGMGMIFFT